MSYVFTEPKLYPESLSMDKLWFISFKDHTGKKQKKYGDLSKYNDYDDRLREANKLLEYYTQQWKEHSPKSLNGELIKHLEFVVEVRKQGKKKKTKEAFDTKLHVFCDWYRSSNYPPVDEMMGFNFLKSVSIREEVNSNTTINDYRRQLTTFFRDLIKLKRVAINPFELTVKLPQQTATNLWFTKEQQVALKKMMFEEGDIQLWLCCLIQFYCFVRPGDEMRFLKLSNIIVDGDQWKFRLQGSSLKTGRHRYVPIPTDLKKLLQKYTEGYKDNVFLFGRKGAPGTIQTGVNYLYNRHRRYMKALDLGAGYSLYSWKNTGAVMMYMNGVKMKYISLLMGHSSIEITDEYFKSLGIDDVMDEVTIRYPRIK